MNDVDCTLAHWPEVLDCIGTALDMLENLSAERPAIVVAYRTLQTLAQQLPLHLEERATIAQRQHHSSLALPHEPIRGQQQSLVQLFGPQPGNGDGAGLGFGNLSDMQVTLPLLPADSG